MGTSGQIRPELAEARIHDVADPATGRVESFPVTGALSAATRAARLHALGYGADASIFATAAYRLSPQAPYQGTPRAWVDAYAPTWSTGPGVDQVWWRLPPTFATEFTAGINLSFQGLGAGAALLSLTVQVWPYSGLTGTLVIDIGALRTEIPVSTAAEHVIDIAFVHAVAGGTVLAMMMFRAGMIDVVWKRAALRRGLVAPGP